MESTNILLEKAIDYTGLFAPAALDMKTAVANYAKYLSGSSAGFLSRFVLPVFRLREFEEAAAAYLPKGNPVFPWKLTALPSQNLLSDLEEIVDFNVFHARDESAGAVVVDTIELKIDSVEAIQRASYLIPRTLTTYFEIPIIHNPADLLEAILGFGYRTKVRTGGVKTEDFPDATHLARLMCQCAQSRIPLKASAALHHAITGNYKLTLTPSSASGHMYGFLNVLLATVLARFDADESEVAELLQESSLAAFAFDETGIQWRRHRLTTNQISLARTQVAMGFSSSLFDEPMAELKKLKLR